MFLVWCSSYVWHIVVHCGKCGMEMLASYIHQFLILSCHAPPSVPIPFLRSILLTTQYCLPFAVLSPNHFPFTRFEIWPRLVSIVSYL